MQIMHTSAQAVATSATAMGNVSAAMDPAKLAAQVCPRSPSRYGIVLAANGNWVYLQFFARKQATTATP